MNPKRYRKGGKFVEAPKVKVKCSVCGKDLVRTIHNVDGKRRFYCSYECQRNRGKESSLEKKCKQCDKTFVTFKSQDQIFCSKDCYTKYGQRLYTCAYCGKQRVDKRCYSEKNQNWYCCRECMYKAFENKITAPYKNLSRTGKWKSWRKRVLKRDGHKCTECGGKNNLEAHHCKKSVKQCIMEEDIAYIFDIDNGITLCSNCHQMTETWGPKNKL